MMKQVCSSVFLACVLVGALYSGAFAAGCPNLLNYQGRVNDTSGVPVSDGTHSFAFRIYAQPSGGSSVWSETVNLTTSGGLFNHILGSVSALPPTLFPDSGLLYLETEVDALTLSPRTQIVSVAYARRVNTVQGSTGGTITGSVTVTDTLFASNVSSNSPLRLQTAGTTRVYVDDLTGNVGIGTTTPGALLDLTTSTGWNLSGWASNLRLTSTSYPSLRFYATGSNRTSFIGNNNDGSLFFGVGGIGDDAGGPAMILSPTGNLGVGISPSPTDRLTVLGNVQVAGGLAVNGNTLFTGIYPYISFVADSFPAPGYIQAGLDLSGGQRGHFLTFSVPTLSEGFTFVQGGIHTLTIDTAGNIGVGTTSPGNILSVVQSSATDPIADAWTVYSSRRWKSHIEPIQNALEKVERLRGVTFDWKKDGKHDIGLIAEEVGQVIPEVVAFEANGQDARSVDYARLVSVLIEAVKEQQHRIEGLESRVSELEGSPAHATSSALPPAGNLPPK